MPQASEVADQAVIPAGYAPGAAFCEITSPKDDRAGDLGAFWGRLEQLPTRDLVERAADALTELRDRGVTFTVYTEKDEIDRALPFDVIPRVLSAQEWGTIERGVQQRVKALNLFLHDIYHDGKIIADGIVPRDLIEGNANYRPEMRGIDLPHGTYVHVAGVDLIRDEHGTLLVLEDNARTPSGVSYVVENRHLMQRAFPDLLQGFSVRDVSDYGQQLQQKLAETAPAAADDPSVVVLTPGIFNSAYYEHIFLAREMGVPLVEGRDLIVIDDHVFAKTVAGLERVDVIYRRIDDAFLDPAVFRADSMLGVPGLMHCLMKGTVTIANAPGTGVSDDKAVYAYMPRIIEYYLSETPILANVDTHICREPDALSYVLDNIDKLVVKPVGESGGYGIVVGPLATAQERAECAEAVRANPSNFIAQPMISLSVCPT
ncbi:MAG: circularly permuted type 2 ATP-grasp protein, partial [Pseudomonadota bacterium]